LQAIGFTKSIILRITAKGDGPVASVGYVSEVVAR
jgi:hypothetical protein